jgi:uncharacterized protein YkwD
MNWIDIVLALVILLSIVLGWYRGFIIGTLALLCWIGSLVAAYLLYPYAARGISNIVNLGVWILPVAFILTGILARIIIGFFAKFIARIIPESTKHNLVNHLLGIIPGAINGWIYSIIISALVLALPIRGSLTETARNSKLANTFAIEAEWANRKLAPVFDDAVRQTINSLTINPSSEESVELPFKYSKGVARPSLEAQMLQMVNEERKKAGLRILKPDTQLTRVARIHSQDMFVRGYFAHVNPEGKDPFDRMKAANVQFLAAGENLALAQTLEIAHRNLMNSPGHRANILNPSYGRLGIGILDGGFYGLMISQEFRN